jgi:hypothetical protein
MLGGLAILPNLLWLPTVVAEFFPMLGIAKLLSPLHFYRSYFLNYYLVMAFNNPLGAISLSLCFKALLCDVIISAIVAVKLIGSPAPVARGDGSRPIAPPKMWRPPRSLSARLGRLVSTDAHAFRTAARLMSLLAAAVTLPVLIFQAYAYFVMGTSTRVLNIWLTDGVNIPVLLILRTLGFYLLVSVVALFLARRFSAQARRLANTTSVQKTGSRRLATFLFILALLLVIGVPVIFTLQEPRHWPPQYWFGPRQMFTSFELNPSEPLSLRLHRLRLLYFQCYPLVLVGIAFWATSVGLKARLNQASGEQGGGGEV